MKRLAIIVSHPIQYYAPLFTYLSKSMTLKVFYGFQPNPEQQGEEGFGEAFKWDLDLLKGYAYEFVENVSSQPSSAKFNGCDTPIIGERIHAFEASHVICFGWHLKMFRQALSYCKSYNIPVAVRGDSQIDPNQIWYKRLLKRVYYPFFLNQFDCFLSVGKRNQEYLRLHGVPEEKIIFSPHAVDQDFWKVELVPEEDKFKFIWVAKFIGKKRPKDVIIAFTKLLSDYPEFRNKLELKMVGTGELLNQCKKMASDIEQVKFLGFKNQKALRNEYANSDCLVLTSDYRETWGLVVNEAFAAGIPAIVSEACGCGPDLIDQFTGLIYPTADIEALAAAMFQMLKRESDSEFQKKGTFGLQKKNEMYSFERNVNSFQEFIKRY